MLNMAKSVLPNAEAKKTSPDSVLLSDLRNVFYIILNNVKKQTTKSLIAQGFLAKNPAMARLPYIIIAVVVGFFAFFASSFWGLWGL